MHDDTPTAQVPAGGTATYGARQATSGVTPAQGNGTADGASAGWHPPAWQVRLWRAISHDPRPGLVAGLLVAVLLGVLGAGVVMTGATTYTSTTVMLIDDPLQLASAGSESQLLKLSTLRLKYADLAQTSVLATPVAHDLGLPVSDVLGAVTVDTPLESLLLNVNATTQNPTLSRSMSQAMANELTTYVRTEDSTYHIPAASRYTLNVVDPASEAIGHGPSTRRALVLGLGLAVLGFLIGLLAIQLRRNWRLPV